MRNINKHQRVIALILITVVLFTTVPLTFWGFGQRKANAMNMAGKEDERIASEISNETGFSIEEVFNYKLPGRSWNVVLKILKNTSRLTDNGSKNDRDSTLINSGLEATFIQQMKKEGFTEQEIIEVKMLVERVMLQLRDIVPGSVSQGAEVEVPKPVTDKKSSDKEDLTSYMELAEKIEAQKAIYFMLKLKADFGSYEKVFDEYLYSIQFGLNLDEYISDKKLYLKKKGDKEFELSGRNVITLEKIEAKSIETLQKDSSDGMLEVLPQKNNEVAGKSLSANKSPLPDVPKAKAEELKPENPTDEVMNEIKEISPVKN